MKIRLGYACITNCLDSTSSSPYTYGEYLKYGDMEKLDRVIVSNLKSLEEIIYYNIKNNIHFYRMSSKIIPLATKSDVKFDYINYVHSSNGVTALSHFREDYASDNTIINKIVSIINGEINSDFLPEWKAKGCEIFYRDEYAFCVRGWGHLIGIGGLHLPVDIAEKIQDGFISYILSRLNGEAKLD